MQHAKLFIGPRIRRLRRERGLSQSAMATELSISPSYLNHLERGTRPVTAAVLLRFADRYEIDVKRLAADAGAQVSTEQLSEIFADELLSDLGVQRYELVELAQQSPTISDAISRLYGALTEKRRSELLAGMDVDAVVTPEIWVRDYIQHSHNHFPELELAAETLAAALTDALSLAEPLRRRLKEAWGISVRIVPPSELGEASQMFDPDRRIFYLSSMLRAENRTFGLAYQLALVEFREVIERLVAAANPPDVGTRHLLHVSLANYTAGAIMMPYGRFLASAESQSYSVDRLSGEYGANVEQISHRLCTLARPGARGVPFFMLRIDPAGNISKRYAGEKFPFSRYGGTCPRWNLHDAFQRAGQVVTQIIETPDGHRYFTVARTIDRPIPGGLSGGLLAIGLGCDIAHAHKLHCATGLDLANPPVTPVGPACAICPRMNCNHRATAPVGRKLTVVENRKTISPYPFEN